MKKRKPKIIKDKKKRGEWAESVFMARAGEQGLPVSKPWGDSRSYDCVVGNPGKFVAVQVKCTIGRLQSGTGYKWRAGPPFVFRSTIRCGARTIGRSWRRSFG
ncbi:MAG: hypothetical protein LAO24_18535 [Acidobacteriia bacterium]|nr:hypothetical protein [Terriglobia bacterium]